jgi:hypothetical protein
MGHTPRLSRREILQTIPLLGRGSLLLPVGVLGGQGPDTLRNLTVFDSMKAMSAAKIDGSAV